MNFKVEWNSLKIYRIVKLALRVRWVDSARTEQKTVIFVTLLFRSASGIWARTWQNQQNVCVPNEDSDQPGHLPNLIRVFAVRKKKAWVLSYPLHAQRRLWSDWADAQADLSLRWAHTHFVGFVMSRLIWFCSCCYCQVVFHQLFTWESDYFITTHLCLFIYL